MDTNNMKHIFKIVNLYISLFVVGSVMIQFLLVVMSIGAVWVIDILLPITLVLFVVNLAFGAFIMFLIIFKSKKVYKSTIVWIFANQILIFIGLISLFASGMTLVNF